MQYNLTSVLKEPLTILDVSSVFHIDLQIQGDQSNFLELDCEPGIRDKIEISQERGKLVIGLKNNSNFQTKEPLKIVLKSNSLKEIELSGACSLQGTCFTASLCIDASGTSSIKLTGSAQDLTLDLSGATHAKLSKFEAQRVVADLSGVSQAKFVARQSCEVDLSGASSATVEGNPKVCQSDTSGVATFTVSKIPYQPINPNPPCATAVQVDTTESQDNNMVAEKEVLERTLIQGDKNIFSKNQSLTREEKEKSNSQSSSIGQIFRSFFRK